MGNDKFKNAVGNINYRCEHSLIKLHLDEFSVVKLNTELVARFVLAVEMLVDLRAVSLKLYVAVFSYKLKIYDKCINASAEKIKGVSIETQPYPLFPTDVHPQMSSLLCFAKGGGEIVENIFPSRFAYVNELIKMGAKIELKNGVIRVFPSELKGSVVEATDLRAGAALITAALGSYGATEINNVKYIVR